MRLIAITFLIFGFAPCSVFSQNPQPRRGVVELRRVDAGAFHEYFPRKSTVTTNVVVIAHGSITDKDPDPQKVSKAFIDRWIPIAESTGIILVAPIFDIENFGSDKNAPGGEAWGFRALDGKHVGSDVFIHTIIDRFKQLDPKYDGRFYLYGHSAGAQFANHYLVVHPDRLHGAIISAAAIFAMPDPETPWPAGMKARKRTLKWGDVTKEFEISHKVETWVSASQVPITVVVGQSDTDKLSDDPQQGGVSRLERARHYVKEMRRFASENNVKPTIRLVEVPNATHSAPSVTKPAMQALNEMVQQAKKKQ